jgi:hypothetical protein
VSTEVDLVIPRRLVFLELIFTSAEFCGISFFQTSSEFFEIPRNLERDTTQNDERNTGTTVHWREHGH